MLPSLKTLCMCAPGHVTGVGVTAVPGSILHVTVLAGTCQFRPGLLGKPREQGPSAHFAAGTVEWPWKPFRAHTAVLLVAESSVVLSTCHYHAVTSVLCPRLVSCRDITTTSNLVAAVSRLSSVPYLSTRCLRAWDAANWNPRLWRKPAAVTPPPPWNWRASAREGGGRRGARSGEKIQDACRVQDGFSVRVRLRDMPLLLMSLMCCAFSFVPPSVASPQPHCASFP